MPEIEGETKREGEREIRLIQQKKEKKRMSHTKEEVPDAAASLLSAVPKMVNNNPNVMKNSELWVRQYISKKGGKGKEERAEGSVERGESRGEKIRMYIPNKYPWNGERFFPNVVVPNAPSTITSRVKNNKLNIISLWIDSSWIYLITSTSLPSLIYVLPAAGRNALSKAAPVMPPSNWAMILLKSMIILPFVKL